MIRIRFETKTIAPKELPSFVYVASVLTHSAVQYTALIDTRDDEEQHAPFLAIRSHWPDAVLISAERGVDSFQSQDLTLNGYVYGTYDQPQAPEPGFLSRSWVFLFGKKARSVTTTRYTISPYSPAPTASN